MNYAREPWVAVYTRDTAGYRAISWQARGLSLELTRKLDGAGEVSLGRRGLEAVAALVGAPWEEVRPFLEELLEDGRLVHDAERRVLRDPQHASRQEAARGALAGTPAPAPAPRRRQDAPAERPRSESASAIRARAYRARKAAERAAPVEAVDPRQLPLPCAFARDERDANVTRHAERHASRANVTRAAATLGDPSRSGGVTERSRHAEPSSPSLSDLPDHQKKERGARTPALALDARAVPPELAAVAAELRPDLHDGLVARSWAVFAGTHAGKWRTMQLVEARWRSWIARERAPQAIASPPADAPSPARSGPSLVRPLGDPAACFVERDRTWASEAASRELALAAASRLAAGLFQVAS